MGVSRSIIAGDADYLGASREDLITELVNFKKSVEETIDTLNTLRIKDTEGLSDRIVKETNLFIDKQIHVYASYVNVFDRLIIEFPKLVIEGHCKVLNKIYSDLESQERACKKYKNDNLERQSNSKEHGLIDKVYTEAKQLTTDLLDIGGLIGTLETYVGLGTKSDKKVDKHKGIVGKRGKLINYGYKTKDVLTFVRRDEIAGGHVIKVNNHKEFIIPYFRSALLLLMAIALKEKNAGWVTADQFKKDGFISAEGKALSDRLYSLMFKLRNHFTGRVKHPRDFIELAKGHCKYRISVNPTNIIAKNLGWLKQEYAMILKLRKADNKKKGIKVRTMAGDV